MKGSGDDDRFAPNFSHPDRRPVWPFQALSASGGCRYPAFGWLRREIALHCGAGKGACLASNNVLAGQLPTFACYHPLPGGWAEQSETRKSLISGGN
jgi:hypothetical protein